MLAGANLNANNRPLVNRTRAEGFARGQPDDMRRNQPPCNQFDSKDDSEEKDDVGYGVAQPVSSLHDFAVDFVKLDRFDGGNFRRWQKKLHFLLTTLKVVYVLTTPKPLEREDETLAET
ncbi:hypothetical protein LWI29_011479 [Acer saccharum]|uniref:Uncharacterized protein n=1 Tax=Acer saccharum TaxID=4024 RepID=A0AA39SZ14_ACESA|nr:hypothetical protein LWI29_011479 [Acer saccharum]